MFDNNPNHKNPFTYAKQITYVGGVTVTIPYKDGGWLNSGKEICSCSDDEKEEVDNSIYQNRATDIITLCHFCHTFWHCDMSD